MIDRRTFLIATSSLVLSPALAEEAPPVLAAYERDTGGRIGVYAENLSSGARIAWRADSRAAVRISVTIMLFASDDNPFG